MQAKQKLKMPSQLLTKVGKTWAYWF